MVSGLLMLLLLVSLPGYLSSPHVGHEPPPSPHGAQHGPVISNPVIPAAVSGTLYYTNILYNYTIPILHYNILLHYYTMILYYTPTLYYYTI